MDPYPLRRAATTPRKQPLRHAHPASRPPRTDLLRHYRTPRSLLKQNLDSISLLQRVSSFSNCPPTRAAAFFGIPLSPPQPPASLAATTTKMNSHTTPRPAFPVRSIGGGGSSHPPQSRQPVAPQVSSNEEYSTIAEEDREHIDEVFDLMDMKKKGWLNSYEFRHSLAALGFDMTKPDYFRELESYGTVPPDWQDPHSCPVNRLYVYLDQFRLCAAKLLANRDPRQEATKVFNMFDYDGDGIISFEDMRRLASDIKEERTMTDEEIQSMIEHLDHEGKGGVNLEEFIQMMEEAG